MVSQENGATKEYIVTIKNMDYLVPYTTTLKWFFQLDDSKPLHEKWMFPQTSHWNWLFRVPGMYISLI